MIRISNIRERNSLGETDKKFDMEIDGKKYNCHQNYNRKDFSIVITNDKKNEVFKMNYNEEFYPGDKSTKLEINLKTSYLSSLFFNFLTNSNASFFSVSLKLNCDKSFTNSSSVLVFK